MSRPDYAGAGSTDGPFQANTRVVAVIALAVAGAFVLLGLVLSIARAMQQRTLDRVGNIQPAASNGHGDVQRRLSLQLC